MSKAPELAALLGDVLVPVMRDKYARAWPEHQEVRPEDRVAYSPIADALVTRHPFDAHLATYSVPSIARRLAKPDVFAELGETGLPIVLFIVDSDDPEVHRTKKPARPEWWQAEKAKLERLLAEHRGGYVYRTRGGYRIVYVLAEPVALRTPEDAETWKRRYEAWLKYLHDRYDIVGDQKCKDWTRLYRLPRVRRDGEWQEHETIGDANAIGIWDVAVTLPEPEVETITETTTASTTTPTGESVFEVLAGMNQGQVLLQISGTWLVNGQAITLGRTDKGSGHRAIIIDGKSTSGYIDDRGRIAHASSATGSPDGGPLVSTWCRHYGHDDTTIRAGLIDLVPELAAWEQDRLRKKEERRKRDEPRPGDLGLDERDQDEHKSPLRLITREPTGEPDEDNVPPPGDADDPRNQKQKRDAVAFADEYISEHATHSDGPLLRRWRGDWYRWVLDRGCYAPQSDEQIESDLYRRLGLGKRSEVGDVRHALIAVDDVLIDHVDLGSFIGSAPTGFDPLEMAPCQNGLLHLPKCTIVPATPRYFATNSLGVAFDPNAPSPKRWLEFLQQLWPEDRDSIRLLQEWFGYLLTSDTRQQKILLLLGPKRSGKGTIARVAAALVGSASCASPTLASLGTNFGLWPLIGKTAAIIGDARLGGRSDIAQVVERLLSISGEDLQTIDRKHREPWTGKLSTRMWIISNEPPRFTDASDALASRMMVLELSRSWYGKEDTALTDDLIAEMPGILAWAIVGWQRLQARGHFVQPASSAGAVDDLIDIASPVAAWARQECRTDGTDPEFWLTPALAYEKFKDWCDRNGHHKPSQTMFGRDVKTATGCTRDKVSRNGAEIRVYRGLVLR